MHARRRAAARLALLVTFTSLMLSACAPEPTDPSASPEPSPTPVFATEAEALAAAEEAYAAYQAALDAGFQSYDTSAIGEVAEGDALDSATSEIERFRQEGKRQVGATLVVAVAVADLGSLYTARAGSPKGQVYACLDLSSVDVLDSAGNSVVPGGISRTYSMIVDVVARNSDRRIVVTNEEVWDGTPVC